MQCADHSRRVEQAIHKWQAVHVRRDIDVFTGVSKSLLSLFKLRARVIKQDNALKAGVARRISSGAGSQFQQEASPFREQSPQGNGFRAVFIFTPALVPKGSLGIGVFLIAGGRRVLFMQKKKSRAIVPDSWNADEPNGRSSRARSHGRKIQFLSSKQDHRYCGHHR